MSTNIIQAISSIVAAAVSLITLTVLLYNSFKQHRNEKMKLVITPTSKLSDCANKVFFLCLAISNESALPISIINMSIHVRKDNSISDTPRGLGGTSPPLPISVTQEVKTTPLPLTIKPYSSFGGYFAFNAGKQDSEILLHKDITLEVQTSRKSFSIELLLNCDNFYEFSYYHGGKISGKAVL